MVAAGIFLVCCSVLFWVSAASPQTCHEALRGASPNYTRICDRRFGLAFIFERDSLANVMAVVGWAPAYLLVVLAGATALQRHQRPIASALISSTLCLALWPMLIWSFDREPYGCAFGFGGFSCSGLLANIGLYAVFGGWVLPLIALVAVPMIPRLKAWLSGPPAARR